MEQQSISLSQVNQGLVVNQAQASANGMTHVPGSRALAKMHTVENQVVWNDQEFEVRFCDIFKRFSTNELSFGIVGELSEFFVQLEEFSDYEELFGEGLVLDIKHKLFVEMQQFFKQAKKKIEELKNPEVRNKLIEGAKGSVEKEVLEAQINAVIERYESLRAKRKEFIIQAVWAVKAFVDHWNDGNSRLEDVENLKKYDFMKINLVAKQVMKMGGELSSHVSSLLTAKANPNDTKVNFALKLEIVTKIKAREANKNCVINAILVIWDKENQLIKGIPAEIQVLLLRELRGNFMLRNKNLSKEQVKAIDFLIGVSNAVKGLIKY